MLEAKEIREYYGEEKGCEGFGYPSDEPCCVCGSTDDNQSEPRFGYTVCINHQHVPPMAISQAGLV